MAVNHKLPYRTAETSVFSSRRVRFCSNNRNRSYVFLL